MSLVSKKDLEKGKVELTIKVEGETFQNGLDAAYKKNATRLNIPGFRKGKAPKNMVLKTYGISVLFDDAVKETYIDAYEEVIKAEKLEPVDYPEVEILDIDENGYNFKAVLTTKPDVQLGKYKDLTAEKRICTVSKEDVDVEINGLMERNARLVDVSDRAVVSGDNVIIDYCGKLDGRAFDGGTAQNETLVIGSGQFIPGFEEQVIGHTIGEDFDIDVTFPEQYPAEELAGKAVIFSITLHAIKTKELPVLDDEFAKDVSDEFDTLDKLKEGIQKSMLEYKEANAVREMEDGLLNQIIEDMTTEIPDVMVERQVDNLVDDFGRRLQQQGMNLETYMQVTQTQMEDFRKNFAEAATRNVLITLALEAIVKAEDIVISEAEFEAELEKLSTETKLEVSKLKELVAREDVCRDIAMNKAIDLVKNSAKIKEVEAILTTQDDTEKKIADKEAKPAAKKAAAPKTEKKVAAKATKKVADKE